MGICSDMKRDIQTALGEIKPQLVFKNATYLNVFTNEFLKGDIAVSDGIFAGIGEYSGEHEIDASDYTIVPGFIDGHMHLESSIVTPAEYAKAVIHHGTSAVIADPHEIANVCGKAGIDYMIEASDNLPVDVYFMVPSCVPATQFDETGYRIDHKNVKKYLDNERVLGLAEMMNYPGVITCDREVIKKLAAARKKDTIIDGHAPGLTGKQLAAYVTAGAMSDHECSESAEAIEKIRAGQWIMIREGTAGKNLKKLVSLLDDRYYRRCLLVTDDRHPGDLKIEGHIDNIIRKAISLGAKPENVYTAASFNAASYFGLRRTGAIAPGYRADFVILEDRKEVKIDSVYKNGVRMSQHGRLTKECRAMFTNKAEQMKNVDNSGIKDTVHIAKLTAGSLKTPSGEAKVIGVVEGELLTTDCGSASGINVKKDILKLCVAERHHATGHVGVCYVKGYKLKEGAVATSIAHDSHNIIAVGASDDDILLAIRTIERMHGGMAVVNNGRVLAELALPVAGLMCELDVSKAQKKLDGLKSAAYGLGAAKGIDPFMTLSFISLPVIPKLRLTSLGVVDVDKFSITG